MYLVQVDCSVVAWEAVEQMLPFIEYYETLEYCRQGRPCIDAGTKMQTDG